MEVYNIEKAIVEQERIWRGTRELVEDAPQGMQLHEFEGHLFKKMMELGLSLTEEFVARQGSGKAGSTIERKDGVELTYNGMTGWNYLSVFGELRIERAYYLAEGEMGYCPLDEKLNLPQRHISYLLEQWLLSDVAETTYEEAIERMERIFGYKIWKRRQEMQAVEVAADMEAFYEHTEPCAPQTEGSVICATADCKGVRMVPSEKPDKAKLREEGTRVRRGKGHKSGHRKDAVVTSDYTFIPEKRTPEEMARILMGKQTQDEQQREHLRRKENSEPEPRSPLNKLVFATMYGKEAAFENLADRIEKRDPEGEKPIYIMIDGEPALEKGMCKVFEQRGWSDRIDGICLDIYHVMEYIWEAGTALHGEKNPAREKWVFTQTLAILEGRVGRVIGGLRQVLTKRKDRLRKSQKNSLNKVITYFDNHRRMMRYDEYLAAGYPIGTGVIEGACGSLVKERMDGSGKRWTKKGAQGVLDLRSIKRNGDWDTFWQFHIEQEQERLYGKAA